MNGKKTNDTDKLQYSYQYPHPAVTTDCVIFGFDGKQLHILLVERGVEPFKGSWALPGGFLKMDETVEKGAARELAEETREDVYLEQFHVFSSPDRDPRERVITVAFYALVRKSDYRVIAGDDAARAMWFEVEDLPPLAFDHEEIIDKARQCLKDKLKVKPIAFRLLDDRFSMGDLQRVYEQITGMSYDRRNFQRKALASGLLVEPEDERDDISLSCCCEASIPAPTPIGRPSQLFTFDEDAYEEDRKKGESKRNPFEF